MAALKGLFSNSGVKELPYVVLRVWEDKRVELREYDSSSWVCNDSQNTSLDGITKNGFFRNFKYIQGKNDQNCKIAMTSPVLISVENGAADEGNKYCTGFYVDRDTYPGDSAPAPTAPDVYLKKLPKMQVYVRKYGGFNNNKTMNEEAKKLREDLAELGLKYDASTLYFAGYDPPLKLTNRRNEVMFRASN